MILQFDAFIKFLSAQMGVAAIVHLYVFPVKQYELIRDKCIGSVAVMTDYASIDSPLDPKEVKYSDHPTNMQLPQPDIEEGGGMTFRESVHDVVFGGGEYVIWT